MATDTCWTVSEGSAAPRPVIAAARSAGMVSRPRVSAAAALPAPTASGGTTDPMLTARTGSSPVASSHRPIQPVVIGESGLAVCQMSIDRKWL